MTAEADVADFGILCGVPVNQEVAFAGANGPRCRQRSVLRRRYIADRVRYNRRVGAKFSLSPLWHAILVNGNPAIAGESDALWSISAKLPDGSFRYPRDQAHGKRRWLYSVCSRLPRRA